MSMHSNAYIGIDLGTTNTRVAQVTADPQGRFSHPVYLPIDQQVDEHGNRAQRETLPSAVYVSPDGRLIPGAYARQRMVSGYGVSDVIAEWKDHLGRPDSSRVWRFHKREWTPLQAATAVLRHIREQFAAQTDTLPVPVVTIPASFPESMKAATREAIRDAGWVAPGEEPLLLYEPLAALIAYLDRYEREQLILPPGQRALDWEQGGNMLVYDIGGGTVDVVMARLEPCHDPSGKLRIRAHLNGYAPHALLGGVRFDEKFAHALVARFQKEHRLAGKLSKRAARFLFFDFLSWAENAKMELVTGQPEVLRHFSVPPELNLAIRSWACRVRYSDYLAAVRPLLGEGETTGTPLPSLAWRHVGEAAHILEPVIRLLQSQQREPSDISAVLLVGGMSHLPAIRERLQAFFGPQTPLLWNQVDPLKAVAYGAALHNAQLNRGCSVHQVLLRPAAFRVFDPVSQRAAWLDLIPPQTSLSYGDRFEGGIDALRFPAMQREVTLKARYGDARRNGARFGLSGDVPLDGETQLVCTAHVDSANHILTLRAALPERPEVTVRVMFDENPDRAPETPPNLPDLDIPDPEADLKKANVSALLHRLRNANTYQQATSIRQQLERAARLGAYVEQMAGILRLGKPYGKQHACLLVAHAFQRYTFWDILNPRTPVEIARALRSQQPRLASLLKGMIQDAGLYPLTRVTAAHALGFVTLWAPQYADVASLLGWMENRAISEGLGGALARTVGRTVERPEHWRELLRFWHPRLLVELGDAVLWAISRGVTRHPQFVPQTTVKSLVKFFDKVLDGGVLETQSHPSSKIAAWYAIALLNLTADIGREQPVYFEEAPELAAQIREKAETEQTRQMTDQTDSAQVDVAKAAAWVLRCLDDELIVHRILPELETLPVG